MDPIHPIVPQAPILGPVAPAPAVGRVSEHAERRRREAAERERRRRQRLTEPDFGLDDGEDDDDGRPHVDLTV